MFPFSAASSSPDEDAARIKAEKIKIAIEKIKEASVKKLFIKVSMHHPAHEVVKFMGFFFREFS